nr:protein FAM83H [Nothobranchius furzeri]XP_015829322.2 protein FAM83H [Nothobranchius furzeri]
MARRSQSSSIGDNPLDPNYLPPLYREGYRLAIDELIEKDIEGYNEFIQKEGIVNFLAQPEIEHIKSTLQIPNQTSNLPELTYYEGGQETDGSSGTYWPMESDTAAPGLDLGWPQFTYAGPTEVTTLVNPSEPDVPSIKERARRLIKNARQVIAIAMDIFTDVDIFSELLEAAARQVAVYILLDEQDAHHFVSMVSSCKVNLDLIQMMRVRTVGGITYYSRTGKSFKGQMKNRFMLTDCRAALSGNYSFMWSYEKIHRCMVHLFLGEMVNSFDEEFRILYAQSEPLVINQFSVPLAISDHTAGSYLHTQIGLKRTQSLLNSIGYRQPEITPAFPYGDADRNPFRRNDPFRHTLEPNAGITIGKYSQQQFRLQQSYLDQGKSIVSRQMEMKSSAFKRHSYAEGTQETYSSSRQFMKHRVMNNLDETDFHREQFQSSHYYSEGPGPGSGHGHYDRLRGYPSHLSLDQYSDSSYRSSDLEPPLGNKDYFSSDDLKGPEGLHGPPLAGRYEGGTSNRRPTIGHTYACQSSPTQLHPPEKKSLYKHSGQTHDQDPSVKEGMRNWRINSYLSNYDGGGEEGLPEPMGPDTFDDPPAIEQPTAPEISTSRFGVKEPPNVFPMPRPDLLTPRFGKPKLTESSNKDYIPSAARDVLSSRTDYRSSILEKEKERESERVAAREAGEDTTIKDAPDLFLSRHESVRSRINPLLQRSSRLRSSLIFASSKTEIHSGSLGLKPATEEDEQLDSVQTSSIVAQILAKRRSLSREPYEWRKKFEERQKDKEMKEKEEEKEKEPQEEKRNVEVKTEIKEKEEPQNTDKEEKSQSITKPEDQKPVNVTNVASRLQYFQDLENKRKVSKLNTDISVKASEPPEKKPDLSEKPPLNPSATLRSTTGTISPADNEPKKPDISAKLAELNRRPTSPKVSILTPKPFVSSQKSSETSQSQKEETVSEGPKKELPKLLKPLSSPKIFKKDALKLKGLNPRRVSCGEEILTTDATDAEKSELKKNRARSSSTLSHEDFKEGLHKRMGSSTSINTIGEGKGDGKTLEFLKKQTQRLKGFLGPKDKDKKASGEERNMTTVMEVTDDPSKNQSSQAKETSSTTANQPAINHKTSSGTSGSSRYQSPGSSVLFSSNLRDDTKVILEQISANSQKNRQEREETGGDKGDVADKGLETSNPGKKSRFLRTSGNSQEREGLLKRIESLRKEKKVYSRFEMGNSLG